MTEENNKKAGDEKIEAVFEKPLFDADKYNSVTDVPRGKLEAKVFTIYIHLD